MATLPSFFIYVINTARLVPVFLVFKFVYSLWLRIVLFFVLTYKPTLDFWLYTTFDKWGDAMLVLKKLIFSSIIEFIKYDDVYGDV